MYLSETGKLMSALAYVTDAGDYMPEGGVTARASSLLSPIILTLAIGHSG